MFKYLILYSINSNGYYYYSNKINMYIILTHVVIQIILSHFISDSKPFEFEFEQELFLFLFDKTGNPI